MKNCLTVLLIAFTFLSCGTTKTIRNSKKVIKGAWELSEVSFSDYGSFRTTFFGDASKSCLEGSNWVFVPNNNTGTYLIEKGNCSPGLRNFIFTIQEVNPETGLYDFLLKPTDEKKKSADNKGYRVNLSQLSDIDMQWVLKTSIDGKTITINMNFTKLTE